MPNNSGSTFLSIRRLFQMFGLTLLACSCMHAAEAPIDSIALVHATGKLWTQYIQGFRFVIRVLLGAAFQAVFCFY